jgi:NAD+ kinase
MSEFRNVAIVGRHNTPDLVGPLADLAHHLASEGYKVFFDSHTACAVGHPSRGFSVHDFPSCMHVAIVVGGDGTMLGFGREIAPSGIPLIGVNRGRVGFITDIPLSNAKAIVSRILAGEFIIENRALLSTTVIRGKETIYMSRALNDVTVTRGGISGMVELSVAVDGQFMYEQRSDGIIIATPTGSSAYSLSAGGPLLHPRLRSVVITPIAPQKLSNRPIVLPGDSKIEVTLVAGKNINMHSDMQMYTELRVGDTVQVTRSEHVVPFLHPKGHNHYVTLRQKLHWNE